MEELEAAAEADAAAVRSCCRRRQCRRRQSRGIPCRTCLHPTGPARLHHWPCLPSFCDTRPACLSCLVQRGEDDEEDEDEEGLALDGEETPDMEVRPWFDYLFGCLPPECSQVPLLGCGWVGDGAPVEQGVGTAR